MADPGSRVLAVDLGDVRVGVALSDPMGWTAQPLPTIPAKSAGGPVKAVAALVREHDVETVVVGLPLLLSGEEGERARLSRAFGARLGAEFPGLEIVLWDERMTSSQAERQMIADGVRRNRRKATVDAVAATLILQSYLDARS